MTRFVCTMNDGDYINVPADKMQIQNETMVCAYCNGALVAMVDIAAVVCARLSEPTDKKGERE